MRKLSTMSLLLVFTILFGVSERASAQSASLTILASKKNSAGQCYQTTPRASSSTMRYVFAACQNGKMMIVDKVTYAQTFIQVSSKPLTSTAVDAYTVSVGSIDGDVYVYSNTPPFKATRSQTYFSKYGLNSFSADSGPRGSLLFGKGSTEVAMNSGTVFISQINDAEVALEIDKSSQNILVTYGQPSDLTSTQAYNRSGKKIGSFPHIASIYTATPALYANESVVIETTQAKGTGVGIFDATTFQLLYLLPEPYTNVVTVVDNHYLIGGTEQGNVYLYDIKDPTHPVWMSGGLFLPAQGLGYTGPDIEVRTLSSTPDGKIYAGISGGNPPQNPNNLSFVLLQLVRN